MSLFEELKRRNVIRVGIAYAVVAWLVLQVADVILNNVSAPDWVFWSTLLLLSIGFVIVVVFAWVFEMTPEGLKREKDVDRSQSITPQTGKKLDRLIIGVLVLSLGYFVFDKFVLSGQRQAAAVKAALESAENASEAGAPPAELSNEKSIAVLPFVNMSSDQEQEYFSDGLSEELLNLLAKIPELKVTSRSSAFSFKGKDFKISDVGRELKVANVLEGSVRRSGNQIRVTAQLIRVEDDVHLWSETYDRAFEDVFAIQDEISAAVVDQLKVTLLGEAPHVEETDPEAYALFLQARHLGRLGTADAWAESNTLYERALDIDAEYAAAWIGLATNLSNQAGKGLVPRDEGFVRAREAAEQALAADPEYAKGFKTLGWLAMVYDNDLAQAAKHFEHALRLDPSDDGVIGNSGSMLFTLGRIQEAIAAAEYIRDRDPVSPIKHANLGGYYLFAGRWDDAIESLDNALRLSPDYYAAHYLKGTALLFKGETEAALESFEQEVGDEEYRVKGRALALYALGREQQHQAKLQELMERWGDEWPSEVAHVYAYKGDFERAFEWLSKSAREEVPPFEAKDPYLQPLVDDPRWLPLLEATGQSPEQLDAIEFEMELPH